MFMSNVKIARTIFNYTQTIDIVVNNEYIITITGIGLLVLAMKNEDGRDLSTCRRSVDFRSTKR